MDEARLARKRWAWKVLTVIVGIAVLGAPSSAGASARRDRVVGEGDVSHATISKVTFKGGPSDPEIVISGKHFGRRPAPDPATGTSNFGQCGPITGHAGYDFGLNLWLGNRSQLWSAGYTPYVDCIGLIVTRYTDCEIVYRLGSFYAIHYGQQIAIDRGVYKLAEGDVVDITVNGAVLTTPVHYTRHERKCSGHHDRRENHRHHGTDQRHRGRSR